MYFSQILEKHSNGQNKIEIKEPHATFDTESVKQNLHIGVCPSDIANHPPIKIYERCSFFALLFNV